MFAEYIHWEPVFECNSCSFSSLVDKHNIMFSRPAERRGLGKELKEQWGHKASLCSLEFPGKVKWKSPSDVQGCLDTKHSRQQTSG